MSLKYPSLPKPFHISKNKVKDTTPNKPKNQKPPYKLYNPYTHTKQNLFMFQLLQGQYRKSISLKLFSCLFI